MCLCVRALAYVRALFASSFLHELASEKLPPCGGIARGSAAGERDAASRQQTGVKDGKFSSEFDWRAGKTLADSQTFCDVLCRGGAVDMVRVVCNEIIKILSCLSPPRPHLLISAPTRAMHCLHCRQPLSGFP